MRFSSLVLFILALAYVATPVSGLLIINHTAVDEFDNIPDGYIEAAKGMVFHYPGASHGSQMEKGMYLLEAVNSTFAFEFEENAVEFNELDTIKELDDGGSMDQYWKPPNGVSALKNKIIAARDAGYQPNVSLYGWSYHMCNDGYEGAFREADAQEYIDAINQSNNDAELSGTIFVYHTSIMDGGCNLPGGYAERETYNDMIRQAATDNDGFLFDQALIEQWNHNGTDFRDLRRHTDYDEGVAGWGPDTYPSDHTNDELEIRKAKAMWVLLAKLAGWSGTGATTTTTSTTSTSTTTTSTTTSTMPDNFTIIVLPDTQNYVNNGNYPQIFTNQTQWIANNKDPLNIKFVTHEGDVVQSVSSSTEWGLANESMSILDASNIPYSISPGNHDHEGNVTTGPTTYYNTYFPVLQHSNESWWGGSYNGNDNSYQLMTIAESDYIFLSLDWCPDASEISWANDTLTTYSGRKAILTTHGYLSGSGARNVSRCDTQYIWDDLIKHNANLRLVLCGHSTSGGGEAARTDNNLAGEAVHQLLADYQSRGNGGNGWLRIMTFAPSEDRIYVKTYSPWLDSYETDTGSEFVLDYDMSTTTTIQVISYNQTQNFTAGNTTTVNASTVNVTLDIVTNSNITNANITIGSYSENPTNSTFSIPSLGRYLAINASQSLIDGMNSTMLQMYYTEGEVNSSNLNESTLALYWYNSSLSQWQILNATAMDWVHDTGVETIPNYVWANISHFSTYAIGGERRPTSVELALILGWNLISIPLVA